MSDDNHQVVQSLLDRATSTFKSTLIFTRHPYLVDSGERVCTARATYVSTNSSETTSSVTVGVLVNHPLEFKLIRNHRHVYVCR